MLCNTVVGYYLKTLIRQVIPKNISKKKINKIVLESKLFISYPHFILLPSYFYVFYSHFFLKIGILPNLKLAHFYTNNKNIPRESQKFEFNY